MPQQTLGEYLRDRLREAIADAIKDVESELTRIAEAGGEKAAPAKPGTIGSILDILGPLLNALTAVVDVLAPELGAAIEMLKAADGAGGDSGRSFGIGYFLGYSAFQLATPYIEVLQHAIADAAQTDIFDPQTAATLEAKRIIDNKYGRSEAAGGNLDGGHYDKLVDAQLQRPELAQLLDLWLRGHVNETDVTAALERNGVPDVWIGPLKELRRVLLSPADLALAALRGVIDDRTLAGYRDQLGVTPDDMQVLIDNTGEPPGLMQLLEAYRRGFIPQDRLERGIRQSRVRNEWIDVVEKLRYTPMSTADAARAVVQNYLPVDEGAAIAQQNGLTPDHWPFIVESYGRPLSHEQMLQLYHRGKATIDQVRQAIRESDVKDKYIDQAIDLGRRLIPERTVTMMLRHGVIAHDAALTMLHDLGFDDADAQRLIDLGVSERTAAHKELSKSDIVAMYEDRLLPRDQAVKHLASLGYSDTDATAILALADVKHEASIMRDLQRQIEASLRAGHLSKQEAINQLEHAGLDNATAVGLTDEWLQVRGKATRGLTEAQILKAGELGLITVAQTRARLIGYGLAEPDADLLMSIHGVQPAASSPPQAATAAGGETLTR